MFTLKVNSRNDLHLPAELLSRMNLGKDRMVKVEVQGSTVILVPVDLEVRYSQDELDALDRIHAAEKPQGWTSLNTAKDIDRFIQD